MSSQQGKTFLVTGANTGLGYETCLELAKKNAHVILTGRNAQKLAEAKKSILELAPAAHLTVGIVDLADSHSIREFAKHFIKTHTSLDVLINNAGVMFPPPGLTVDGYETQWGINFIGHYLLTAQLFPLLKKNPSSRIVTLSSIAHLNGHIDFENLKLEKEFDKFREYGQSKVADLIFSLELQRKFNSNNLSLISVACHPGISKTELLRTDSPEMIENFPYMEANQGALSTLYAATADIAGGIYIGPNGEREINGYPARAFISDYASDKKIGQQLWKHTAESTGVSFDFS